jgi:hypothetical protein
MFACLTSPARPLGLQVTLVDLARRKLVPVIDERIDEIGLPGIMLVKKVKIGLYPIATFQYS